MKMPDYFAQLGLSMLATPAEVRARFLELAKIHHPDHGGQAEAFQALKLAHDEALAFAELPKPCPVCKGTKVEVVKNGFTKLKKMCSACRGSGQKLIDTGPSEP